VNGNLRFVPTNAPPTEAVVELLGLLAYAELVAFDRMAADARLAPDLGRRAVLSDMAAREMEGYRRLTARLRELGADPEASMLPYGPALEHYHAQTEPRDWLEALAKAYVGEGIADDFYREIAEFLDDSDRVLVLEVLHDSQYADFAAAEIRAAIDADPKVANRLSMWARRLVGEALSQAQHIAAERDALSDMIVKGAGDLAAVGHLLKRLTTAHANRMSAVGLNN
jgi:hypothetical protein